MVAGETIAKLINVRLNAFARIAFAIDGAGARCTASVPIENTGAGNISTLFVDDPGCLKPANHCNPDFNRALGRWADPGRGCGLR